MFTKNNAIACDRCGMFISYKDLMHGRATHEYVLPDSEFSKETFESKCWKCVQEEKMKCGSGSRRA